jgi:hypothetical protein
LKRTPTVVGELLWKPFNVRFGDFIQNFRDHRDLIQLEIGLIQSRISHRTESILHEEQRLAENERTLNKKARETLEKLKELGSSYAQERIKEQQGN